MGVYQQPQIADSNSTSKNIYVHYGHMNLSSPIIPIQYGWMPPDPGYSYGPIIRDHYVIHFIVRGRGKVVAGDREYNAGANDCFSIIPHQITQYKSSMEDPWEYFWIGFEGEWADDLMNKCGFDCERHVRPIVDEHIFAILRDLRDRITTSDFFLYLSGAILEILCLLKGSARKLPPAEFRVMPISSDNEYVQLILSIIHNSYNERINIQALADRLGLNRCYMSELFHKHTGMPIKSYLIEYRLQRALIELQFPKHSIKQIAYECGFQDALYFSRVFKARFGMSPDKYRETKM